MEVWVYDWNALPTPQIVDIDEPTVDSLMAALKNVFELNNFIQVLNRFIGRLQLVD